MAAYKCPMCEREVPRDLVVFLDHTNSHIYDLITKHHPDWKKEDGTCQKCIDFFEAQMHKE